MPDRALTGTRSPSPPPGPPDPYPSTPDRALSGTSRGPGVPYSERPRGRSSAAEHQLPKLRTRVRFPSPALSERQSASPARPCFQYPRTVARARGKPSSSKRWCRMRYIAAASPAAQILQPSAIVDDATAATSASPGARVGLAVMPCDHGRSPHRERKLRLSPADLDVHLDRDRGRHPLEELGDGGDRRLVPDEQEASRVRIDAVAPPWPRHRHRVAGCGCARPPEAAPPSWTTICTSSSPAIASNRRGVSVRITGRSPFGSRNSFPVHTGTTRSAPGVDGRSTRTLAAGSLSEKSESSGPPSTTLTMCGVSGSTRRTRRPRNFGGSRRIRSVGSTRAR